MSRSQLTNYARPSTPDEALTLLHKAGKSARYVGGGADVARSLPSDVTTLIDICALNLSSIEEGPDGIVIGATATLNEVLESESVSKVCDGVIAEMMRKVGSPLLRNLATIGGTLVSAHSWSDVIPLFLVLDAQVTLYDGESRTLPLADLYTLRGQLADSILTSVKIPASAAGDYAAFHKFSRTGYDIALLNCACYVHVEAGRCTEARIAVGGTPRLAARLPQVEDALRAEALRAEAPRAEALSGDTIEKIARIAQDTTETANDKRASGEYRKQLVYAGVKRCLRQIAEKLEAKR
ncbi:MAG: FAD binding domain-containing protein [Candidatus Bipolaricaulota bacterium]|nr:FAD binding domain-containing protein [Candidatus Bipolaricaulota bacterium]